MKKVIGIFSALVLIFIIGNRGVFAQSTSCSITTTIGSSNAGGNSFRVNALINTSSLTKGTTYRLITFGTLGGKIITTFVPDANTGIIQESFDVSDTPGSSVNLGVAGPESVGQNVCQTSVALKASTTPNTNDNLPSSPGNGDSVTCLTGQGINTAIGCIPFGDQNQLIGFFLRWGIGIGGGIAFLLILMAGFQIMTSRGDPKRLQAGQEMMTSAIAGLLLLIFSLVILRIIGFDILGIVSFK
jgi:hypothetical protein